MSHTTPRPERFGGGHTAARVPAGRGGAAVGRGRRVATAVLVAAAALTLVSAVQAGASTGLIAPETEWQTPWYLTDSGTAGPTVLVTGGVHGNEPAGVRAAEQIRHWPLAKGRLLVIPRCNVPGLEAGKRRMPGQPKEAADLNRNFPRTDEANAARGPAAKALWAFIQKHRPDYTVDLHEGYGFRSAGSKSVGSSIIRVPHPETRRLQDRMLEAVNAADPEHPFARLRGGADGSLARACGERLGARAFILETTYKHQPLARRVRQHRIMVHTLLDALGMAAGDRNRMVPAARPTADTVYAAVYDGPGTRTNKVPPRFERILDPAADVLLRRVAPADIREGALDQFDTVIFPGGSGSGQAKGLREAGRQAVRRFVRRGGGYVGVCAGAYLATANYDWSLALLAADSIDRKHWRRGKGTVRMALTPAGRTRFGREDAGPLDIHFHNGPILAPADREDLPDYTVLARYRTGIGKGEADPAVMVDTPAVASGAFGQGRVLVFSPHPDMTEGLHDLLVRAVRWTAGRRRAGRAWRAQSCARPVRAALRRGAERVGARQVRRPAALLCGTERPARVSRRPPGAGRSRPRPRPRPGRHA